MGSKTLQNGKVAEWSKALALGASPKGRGFEPHLYQIFFHLSFYIEIHDPLVYFRNRLDDESYSY